MSQKISKIVILMAFTIMVASVFANPNAKIARDEMQTPFDPNKKKAGEECKVSDECQKHHACTKNGDKNICTAPPRPVLPPNTVT